ncbi:MAG: AAA family ATPase [Chloroflexi bacterium]|nr:AAA family ATPase [Chloroflexota bacterium]
MARLVLYLFGSPRVEVDDRPITVDTRKATALLAYLAVTGATHQRDALAARFWPEYNQSRARSGLRRTLSTLNRALEGQHGISMLDVSRESLGLKKPLDMWMDVAAFQAYASSGSSHGHNRDEVCRRCVEEWKYAAGLYRGPFMEGFNLRDSTNFEEWHFLQKEMLQRDFSNLLERLLQGLCAFDQIKEAIPYARRWLALDPLMEEPHRQLMSMYTRAGQRSSALRQYRECVRILERELGVTPLKETTELYWAIRNHQTLPEEPQGLHPIESSPAAQYSEPLRPPPAVSYYPPEDHAPITIPASAKSLPGQCLVGRSVEWKALVEAYRQSGRKGGQFVSLRGEAGIGKTHLAEAFLAAAREHGSLVIQARCYMGESALAYAPFIEALRTLLDHPESLSRLKRLPDAILHEAGRFLPEIRTLGSTGDCYPVDELTTGEAAQTHFFESIRQVFHTLLNGSAPAVLFLDNLQWAHPATIDLLAYLARRLNGSGILLLVSWRDDNGENVSRLDQLSGELFCHQDGVQIELKRLDREAVVDLVRAFSAAGQPAEDLGRELYEESEGLPFVAVEYLSAVAHSAAGASRIHWKMPDTVRDLLRTRLMGLDASARHLLSAAAVLGRSFDLHTLRACCDRSEMETVEGLDQLLSAGLVAEVPGSEYGETDFRYKFTHEKLRALVIEETHGARRHLLQRRVAQARSRP